MQAVKVWDKFIRGIHWSLAGLIFSNLFLLESGDPPHKWVGYVATAIVLLRGYLGIKGSYHSQFKNFPVSISQLINFIGSFMKKQKMDYPGHNPLASFVYLFVWVLILMLGISGFMMGTDKYWGEEWLENFHSQIGSLLQALIAIHLIGIALDSIKFKRKTWMKMIK